MTSTPRSRAGAPRRGRWHWAVWSWWQLRNDHHRRIGTQAGRRPALRDCAVPPCGRYRRGEPGDVLRRRPAARDVATGVPETAPCHTVVASAAVVRAARVDHPGVVGGGHALFEPLSNTPVGEVCRKGRSCRELGARRPDWNLSAAPGDHSEVSKRGTTCGTTFRMCPLVR